MSGFDKMLLFFIIIQNDDRNFITRFNRHPKLRERMKHCLMWLKIQQEIAPKPKIG